MALFLCVILFFTTLLCQSVFAGISNCSPSRPTEKVFIDKVIDGDSLQLGDKRKIRLIGVNTTEIGYQGHPSQPFAKAAKKFTQAFFSPSGIATLQVGTETHDRYGRLLAHLFNEKGENLEAALLVNGLAYHVTVPPNFSLASCLARQEKTAQKNKQGLWASPQAFINKLAPGYRRITGTVKQVVFGKSWWISFKEPALAHFVAVISKNHQSHFNQQQVGEWSGKTMELEGWIYQAKFRNENQLRMNLQTPFSMTIYD